MATQDYWKESQSQLSMYALPKFQGSREKSHEVTHTQQIEMKQNKIVKHNIYNIKFL